MKFKIFLLIKECLLPKHKSQLSIWLILIPKGYTLERVNEVRDMEMFCTLKISLRNSQYHRTHTRT